MIRAAARIAPTQARGATPPHSEERSNAPRRISTTGLIPIATPAPPKPAIGIKSWSRFSLMVICVYPPRTVTETPRSRHGGPPNETAHVKDRPSWLTCPGVWKTSRISLTRT